MPFSGFCRHYTVHITHVYKYTHTLLTYNQTYSNIGKISETTRRGLTCTSASFMALQLDTLHAHSRTRYGFMWPLDWPNSVKASHWFSSLEHLGDRG